MIYQTLPELLMNDMRRSSFSTYRLASNCVVGKHALSVGSDKVGSVLVRSRCNKEGTLIEKRA